MNQLFGLAIKRFIKRPPRKMYRARFVLPNFGARKSDFNRRMEGKSYKANLGSKSWVDEKRCV